MSKPFNLSNPFSNIRLQDVRRRPWPGVVKYGAAAVFGSVLALAVSRLLTMELRYVAAVGIGVLLLAAGMVVAAKLRDLLLYVLAFNLPFTTIEKTFLLNTTPTFVVSGVAIGLADIALGALCFMWFSRIIIKEEPLPRLNGLDWWILAFIVVHALSLPASVSPNLTGLEVIRLSKFALLYFYLSRNIKMRHLKVIVAGVMLSIVVQATIGAVQHRTGRLMGIGRTKGAEMDYEQYEVPGFESVRRAEGTAFDSHSFGLLFAMTLPMFLAIAVNRRIPAPYRYMSLAAAAIGLCGLIVSFSRASWLAFAVAVIVLAVCVARWKEWRVLIGSAVVGILLGGIVMLPFARYIKMRIFDAPSDIMSARVETLWTSYDLWRESPWTGVGANSYMAALESRLGMFSGDPFFIPPHNMLLFVLAELGPLGIVTLLGLSISFGRRAWKVVAQSDDPMLRAIAAGVLAAIVALHVEGITDPIYVTTVAYYLLWFQIGLGAAVFRLAREKETPGALPA